MSRSGYVDDCEGWSLIRWRGAVASALRGKRGQAFLKEMLQALNSLPAHRLVTSELEHDGEVCAIGAVGKRRGISMSELDPEDHETIATKFGLAHAMACEIMYMNDEAGRFDETPEHRFKRMRNWILEQLGVTNE